MPKSSIGADSRDACKQSETLCCDSHVGTCKQGTQTTIQYNRESTVELAIKRRWKLRKNLIKNEKENNGEKNKEKEYKDMRAHHLIPIQALKESKVVQYAVEAGFDFNSVENGKFLHKNIHNSSHPDYSIAIMSEFKALERRYPNLTKNDAKDRVEDFVKKLKNCFDHLLDFIKDLKNYINENSNCTSDQAKQYFEDSFGKLNKEAGILNTCWSLIGKNKKNENNKNKKLTWDDIYSYAQEML